MWSPVAGEEDTRPHAHSRAGAWTASCRRRAARDGACGRVSSSPATGLHTKGRPAPSWCSIPPAVQPEPSFSAFLSFLPPSSALVHLQSLQFTFSRFSSSSVASVHLQSASVHLQSYSLRFGSYKERRNLHTKPDSP